MFQFRKFLGKFQNFRHILKAHLKNIYKFHGFSLEKKFFFFVHSGFNGFSANFGGTLDSLASLVLRDQGDNRKKRLAGILLIFITNFFVHYKINPIITPFAKFATIYINERGGSFLEV